MAANKVEIYTWSYCPFCKRTVALLNTKGIEYTNYVLDGDEEARTKMAQRGDGKRSVPQVFVNDKHIGGHDKMFELEAKGELNALLGIA
ncbi:MAG TPA: glutaredoxin 3 [Allocoleopsis sp.]